MAEADAVDDLEDARAAHAACEARAAEAEAALDEARRGVAAAADEVIRATTVAALFNEAQALQARLVERRVALHYLLRHGLVAQPERAALVAFMFHNGDVLPGSPGGVGEPTSVEFHDWRGHATTLAWARAREELARDPDAELPATELGG
jgi:hypothetical protein